MSDHEGGDSLYEMHRLTAAQMNRIGLTRVPFFAYDSCLETLNCC